MDLPKNITATSYDEDIVLSGPTMTADTFTDIKNAMQPEDQKRVIGWIRTGRLCAHEQAAA